MPNYCLNYLRVSGDKKTLDEFEKRAESFKPRDSEKNPVISFEAFLPTPPSLLEDDSRGWYDWRIENWGTKWDTCEPQKIRLPDDPPDSLTYSFDTAWAPPQAWLDTVSVQYPTLRFVLAYSESGNDFHGQVTIVNGEADVTELTYEEFLCAYSEGFREEKETCQTSPMEELADILTNGDGLLYSLNEATVLKRMKDKDLKLFNEAKWNDFNVEQEYKERVELYRIKKTKPENRPLLIGTFSTKKANDKLEILLRGKSLK